MTDECDLCGITPADLNEVLELTIEETIDAVFYRDGDTFRCQWCELLPPRPADLIVSPEGDSIAPNVSPGDDAMPCG